MLDEKITVIICTKNRKKDLCNCLKSLLKQSYKKFDVIIVDQSNNGGAFTYKDINFSRNNSIKIDYIKDSGSGLSRARNIGITASNSNYIVFVDDDGVLDKDCISEYSKNLNKYDFVAGRILNFNKTRYNRNHGANSVDINNMFKVFYVSGGNFGFQKRICEKIGMFDTALGAGEKFGASEETDFCYRAFLNGFRGFYSSKAIYYHPHIKFDKQKIISYGLGRGFFYRKNLGVRKILLLIIEIIFRANMLLFTAILSRRINCMIHYHILKAEIYCFATYRKTTLPLEKMRRLDTSPLTNKSVRKIRVGINASKVFDVHTGVGRYTSNLCRSVLKTGGIKDYYFYTPGNMGNTIMTGIEGTHFEKPMASKQNNMMRILWEQIVLPIYSRKDRLDLFHYTDHALSLLFRKCPIIITIHDIAYLRFPNLLNTSRRIYKKNILRISIKKADIIIADSYATKKDIIEYFGIREGKIRVIHLGVESRFRPINNVEEFRLKNNLPSKMILNVGTLEPRKNVVSLIKAFKKLREKGLKDYKLVIAGEKGWLYKEIFKEAGHSDLKQEILFLGVVKDEDLPMLYNCADIFVYPSLYEGFGLPPLEAMACGMPVITSNTSSLPEVVGDAGIMVAPTDVNSLCEAMHSVLTNKELWNRMSNMGLERSKLFSWDNTVKKILEIYDEVISVYKYQ
jgi:glycosyltransferase involved in cell wall biosynthesis/GT2 family glycosyltransferase